VAEDWDEATVTWNNAPLAVENVAAARAGVFPEEPGEPRQWDVSRAAAEASARGTPLRLALYEADRPYHSGKYFWSSDVDEWSAELRPTLTITWGRPLATLARSTGSTFGYQGDSVTHRLDLVGSGYPLTLTDTLPAGVSSPTGLKVSGTSTVPNYDSERQRLTWTDTPPFGQHVHISYTVKIVTGQRQALKSVAELREAGVEPVVATETVIANPRLIFFPLALGDD
jgi:hypothetical protein